MARVILGKARAHLVGDNAAVRPVVAQLDALKASIEAVGGEWTGDWDVALDDEPVAAVEAVAAVSERPKRPVKVR